MAVLLAFAPASIPQSGFFLNRAETCREVGVDAERCLLLMSIRAIETSRQRYYPFLSQTTAAWPAGRTSTFIQETRFTTSTAKSGHNRFDENDAPVAFFVAPPPDP